MKLKTLLTILLLTTSIGLAQSPVQIPLAPLPTQYGALGMSFDPTTNPSVAGNVEWGKLLTDPQQVFGSYLGASADVIPNSDKSVTLTAIQAKGRQVLFRNNHLALVADTTAGIANNGSSTSGVFGGGFGVVFGKVNVLGLPVRFYVGAKAIETTGSGTKVGPAFALVFTP